jgi:hypothetical protein
MSAFEYTSAASMGDGKAGSARTEVAARYGTGATGTSLSPPFLASVQRTVGCRCWLLRRLENRVRVFRILRRPEKRSAGSELGSRGNRRCLEWTATCQRGYKLGVKNEAGLKLRQRILTEQVWGRVGRGSLELFWTTEVTMTSSWWQRRHACEQAHSSFGGVCMERRKLSWKKTYRTQAPEVTCGGGRSREQRSGRNAPLHKGRSVSTTKAGFCTRCDRDTHPRSDLATRLMATKRG